MINPEDNLNLVHFYLRNIGIKNHYNEYQDLYQVGCEGLCKASKRFDESLGFKFSTYAIIIIKGEIKRYLRDNKIIKINRKLTTIYYNYMKLIEKGYKEEEICKKLEITIAQLSDAINAFNFNSSLDFEIKEKGEEHGEKVLNFVLSESNVEEEVELKERIEFLKKSLNNKNEIIIDLLYKGITNQKEIGKILGLKQPQVSRILKKLKEVIIPKYINNCN